MRKVLRQLAVAAAADPQLLVYHETGRARRALVDREDHDRLRLLVVDAHGLKLQET